LNEQLKLLISLQEIDSSILALADRIETLHNQLEGPKVLLKEAGALFQKLQAKNEKLKKDKKDKDRELEDIEEKINKLKARSSGIKTNKEYEAHLREIETFEKSKYHVEDEILSVMEDMETVKGELGKEEAKVKKAEDELKKHEKELEDEKEKLKKEIELHKAERKNIVSGIDEDVYREYMEKLKKFGGLAISQAENGICLGCNKNIPPQLFNEIRMNDKVMKCFYCNRFLYYKEKQSPPQETSDSV
jgi:uncharacterized protein